MIINSKPIIILISIAISHVILFLPIEGDAVLPNAGF